MNKTILNVFVGVVVGVLAVTVGLGLGYRIWGNQAPIIVGAGSSAGVTNSTARIASIVWAPATASATSTYLYNGDSTDRIIESSFISCSGVGTSQTYLTGAGLSALTFNAATSSAGSVTGLNGNTNYTYTGTVATSSANVFIASTTDPLLGGLGRIWPAGSYLVWNANATNTATCVVGVHHLSS